MANLTLCVLGGFRARVGSGPPLALPKKTQALLTFLALQPGREHTREKLTALLWADADDLHARHSLRQALFGLRRALGRARGALVEADAVALDPAGVEVDALTFERLAAKGTRPALAEAARLYAGELLEGVSVGEPSFDEWLLVERERFREIGINALARLLEHQTQTGPIDAALPTAVRLLALDPLQERAHRALMQLYERQGRRASALRQYQVCVELLRRELGVEPDEATRELYQKILRQPPALPTTRRERLPRPGSRRGTPRAPSPAGAALTTNHETPLVGRVPEVARLADALERAAHGHGHVVVLVGEAGIGKSRLVEHLALDALRSGHRVVVTRCHETEQVLPFRPWVDALREGHLVAEVDSLGSQGPLWRVELSRILPELGSPGLFPSGTRDDDVRIFEAVTALVKYAASERPLVLILEDLQWADDMTVRLFSFLGRRLRTSAVLLVGTVRDEEMAETAVLRTALAELEREPHTTRLLLGPLSHTDTSALVAALTPTGSPDASIEQIARRVWLVSEGSPFVIVETMRALQERGALAEDATMALAPRVREVVAARLARLSETARHVSTVAAVIGEESTFPLLAEAAGLGHSETAKAIEELVRRRVLAAVGERFHFTHDRVREFAYESLLASARLALHATVAQAMERREAGRLEEVYDRLAHHYSKADDPPRAITYLVLFADKARQRYALDDAARSLDQALALVERLPAAERDRRRLEIVVRKAAVFTTLARFRDVLDLLLPLRERVEALGNLALAGPYYRLLALTHSYLGDQSEARRAAELAIHAAQDGRDDLTAGQAFYVLTIRSYWQAEPLEGIEHGRQAVTHLARTPNRDALGTAYWMLGLNHFLLGDFDRALEAEAEAEAIGNAIGDARVQAYVAYAIGWILGTRGDFKAALDVCRYSLAASRDPFADTLGRTVMGYVHLEKGDAAEALSLLEQAVKRFREFGVRQSAGRVMGYLSEAYLGAGHRAVARDTAEQALALSRDLGDRWGTAWAGRVLGRIAAVEGEARQAASRLEESLAIFAEIPAAFEVARTRLHLAELALARGDAGAAAMYVEEARHIFIELQVPRYVERAERLAGEIGVSSVDAARRPPA